MSSSRTVARWALSLDGAADDVDGDDEAPISSRSSRARSSPKVLSAVAVGRPRADQSTPAAPHPTTNAAVTASALRQSVGVTASSESSPSLAFRDPSSGYDTPGTSTIPTPAEGLSQAGLATTNKMRVSGPTVNVSKRAQQLRQSRYALTSKRKWDVDTEDEDEAFVPDESADASMAQRIQDAEYEGLDLSVNVASGVMAVETSSYATEGRSKRRRAGDVDVSALSLTMVSSRMDVDEPTPVRSAARAAKNMARRSIAAHSALNRVIVDTDDSGSPLTSFDTDDSAFQTEFEAEASVAEVTDTAEAEPGSAAIARPGTQAAPRTRRTAQGAGRARAARQFGRTTAELRVGRWPHRPRQSRTRSLTDLCRQSRTARSFVALTPAS